MQPETAALYQKAIDILAAKVAASDATLRALAAVAATAEQLPEGVEAIITRKLRTCPDLRSRLAEILTDTAAKIEQRRAEHAAQLAIARSRVAEADAA